jgi:site-specific DNA-cytosine methylase
LGSSGAGSLLPLGLDSHRYRCCGNGVVSNVSEWIGARLRDAVESVGGAA